MVGTPVDIMPYVRGVQLILTGYNGYTKGSRIENDKLVREEIVRAINRVRNHMKNIFDIKFKENNMDIARVAKQCMEECDYFSEDVKKAVGGMEHAFLSGQSSPSNRELKKLIQHDHDSITMIIEAVNLANSAEFSINTEEDKTKMIQTKTHQCLKPTQAAILLSKDVLAKLYVWWCFTARLGSDLIFKRDPIVESDLKMVQLDG